MKWKPLSFIVSCRGPRLMQWRRCEVLTLISVTFSAMFSPEHRFQSSGEQVLMCHWEYFQVKCQGNTVKDVIMILSGDALSQEKWQASQGHQSSFCSIMCHQLHQQHVYAKTVICHCEGELMQTQFLRCTSYSSDHTVIRDVQYRQCFSTGFASGSRFYTSEWMLFSQWCHRKTIFGPLKSLSVISFYEKNHFFLV